MGFLCRWLGHKIVKGVWVEGGEWGISYTCLRWGCKADRKVTGGWLGEPEYIGKFPERIDVPIRGETYGKYIRKPHVLGAEQWFDGLPVGPDLKDALGVEHTITENVLPTLEGAMRVHDGDWIVTGVEREKWVVNDRIFKKTYERVEE